MAIVVTEIVADMLITRTPGAVKSQTLVCRNQALPCRSPVISPVFALSQRLPDRQLLRRSPRQLKRLRNPNSKRRKYNSRSAPSASDEWARVVAEVLPHMLPSTPTSGTSRRGLLSTAERARLIATRSLLNLSRRKVPDVNPPGTHTPSASLASVRAAVEKASAPPPCTNQPQSETKVYPFSKCQQAVTPSDQPDGSSNSQPRQAGRVRNSWADMSEHEPVLATGSQSKAKRPLSPPSFPLFTKTWCATTRWEQRVEQAKPLLMAALERLDFIQPHTIVTAILSEPGATH